MQSRKQPKRSQSSPPRGAHRGRFNTTSKSSPPSATSLNDQQITELNTNFDDLKLYDNNPRSFPYSVKQQCWEKAEIIKGRDPDRWRRDPLGNTIFRKLVGCPGCLCHDYDHILPYSKGGKSTLDNCQVLQATVNRSKGNRTDISKADLIRRSSYCRVSGTVVTWTFLNYQHMAMFDVEKMLVDVESSKMENQFIDIVNTL